MSNIIKVYCANCGVLTELTADTEMLTCGTQEDIQQRNIILAVEPCKTCIQREAKEVIGQVIDSDVVYKMIKDKLGGN